MVKETNIVKWASEIQAVFGRNMELIKWCVTPDVDENVVLLHIRVCHRCKCDDNVNSCAKL